MSETDAELRALQSRAYGRDADIADDPAAQRRLEVLEAREPPGDAPALPPAAVPVAPGEADAAIDAPTTPPSDAAPAEAPASGIRALFLPRPRRAWVAIGVSAVALAAVVSAVVTTRAHPVEPGLIDTIPVNPAAQWQDAFGEQTDGSVVFLDYYGITFARNEGWSPRDDQRCLLAVSSSEIDTSTGAFGAIAGGCSAGPFPAVVQFTVDATQPDPLQERFPEGTALQFTLRGDNVEVRADRQPVR